MIPEVEFRYSWVYDDKFRVNPKIQDFLKKNSKDYPSHLEIKRYIKSLQKIWSKQGNEIMKSISKHIGLKWKEKKIIVYVIGAGRPFSDPLTVRLYDNKNDFIDSLSHELIHQIQFQNEETMSLWFKYIYKKHESEQRTVKNHILIHAIHSKVILEIFNKNRLKREIEISKDSPDYARSWEIVQEEGADNIIKKFKELIKK